MKRIYGIERITNASVSIGIFDGVHLGHQKILRELVKVAASQKTKSLVITFSPHPQRVLNPNLKIPFLTSLDHRLKLIEELGVDFCLIIRFTKMLSRTKAEDFIKNLLINKLHIKNLIVGKNFLLGHKEEGDFALLKKLRKEYGFRLFGVKPAKIKGEVVSSTKIRNYIEKGDLGNASIMLGRPVTVLGTVVKGRMIGRKLGFPTANIDPHHEAIPPSGVYAVDVKIDKKNFKAVLNIGTRPTIGRCAEPTIELHIIGFKKNIYGNDIEIIFKRKIRNEKRFKSLEGLRIQIARDIIAAKNTPIFSIPRLF